MHASNSKASSAFMGIHSAATSCLVVVSCDASCLFTCTTSSRAAAAAAAALGVGLSYLQISTSARQRRHLNSNKALGGCKTRIQSLEQHWQGSMEARVEQFHKDAHRPRDKKTPKDIDKLRKFLYKNQEFRFTEREQSHLFQAVQLYVTAYTSAAAAAGNTTGAPALVAAAHDEDEGSNPAATLLEDALKMPFTVFTTSQKKTMLKWLDKFSSSSSSAAAASGSSSSKNVWYQVIDLANDTIEVMDKEGTTFTVNLLGASGELVSQLRQAWETEDEVKVRIGGNSSTGNEGRTLLDVKS